MGASRPMSRGSMILVEGGYGIQPPAAGDCEHACPPGAFPTVLISAVMACHHAAVHVLRCMGQATQRRLIVSAVGCSSVLRSGPNSCWPPWLLV